MDKIYKIIGELMVTLGDMADESDLCKLWGQRESLHAEVEQLEGMREEVLHYQREFHRLKDRAAAAEAKANQLLDLLERAGDCLSPCGLRDEVFSIISASRESKA